MSRDWTDSDRRAQEPDNACPYCGALDTSPNVEAFEEFGDVMCDECAEARFEGIAEAETFPCPQCGGEGEGIEVFAAPGTLDGTISHPWVCHVCKGAGCLEPVTAVREMLAASVADLEGK